jgi:hypothetical protein
LGLEHFEVLFSVQVLGVVQEVVIYLPEGAVASDYLDILKIDKFRNFTL